MRLFLSCFLFLATFHVFSQEKTEIENAPKVKIDFIERILNLEINIKAMLY